MCSQATCRKCKKATWSGCGKHIQQVMRGIPKNKQCSCDKDVKPSGFLYKLLGGK